MTRSAALLVVLCLGCLGPPPGVTVVGGTAAQATEAVEILAATVAVMGDPRGTLARDGAVQLVRAPADLAPWCLRGDAAGCAYTLDGRWTVAVAVGDALRLVETALPHEFCHLALNSSDQGQADACAVAVTNATPKATQGGASVPPDR